MVLDDTQVKLRITGQGLQGYSLHLVPVPQDEFEFLLVNGSRGQQCGFQAVHEPAGRDAITFVELIGRFHGVLNALRRPIAQRYDTMDHFSFFQGECSRNLLVCKANPAAVQTKGLGKKYDALSIKSDPFFRILLSGHHEIVPHAGKRSILEHPGGEGLRFIYDQLDMDAGFGIALLNLLAKQVEFILFNRLPGILPYGMPGFYGF